MKLRDLIQMLHDPEIMPDGEKDWDTLLDYEVQIHTGRATDGQIRIEKVYTDDGDQSINIDVGLS